MSQKLLLPRLVTIVPEMEPETREKSAKSTAINAVGASWKKINRSRTTGGAKGTRSQTVLSPSGREPGRWNDAEMEPWWTNGWLWVRTWKEVFALDGTTFMRILRMNIVIPQSIRNARGKNLVNTARMRSVQEPTGTGRREVRLMNQGSARETLSGVRSMKTANLVRKLSLVMESVN